MRTTIKNCPHWHFSKVASSEKAIEGNGLVIPHLTWTLRVPFIPAPYLGFRANICADALYRAEHSGIVACDCDNMNNYESLQSMRSLS